MLLFIGIYIARVRRRVWPGSRCLCLPFFLFKAEGKSSTALFFAVLLLTSLTSAGAGVLASRRHPADAARDHQSVQRRHGDERRARRHRRALPIDATFTGRADIWTFAVQALQARLLTGYGFSAFWGGSSIQSSARHGVGGVRLAQPQRISRHRADDGIARIGVADRGAGVRAVARFPHARIGTEMAGRWRGCCCSFGCSDSICRRWRVSFSIVSTRCGSRS